MIALRESKKLNVFVIAFVIAFTLAVAGASFCSPCQKAWASTGTISVVTTDDAHEYCAYQLFNCEVSGEDDISQVSTENCMPEEFYVNAFAVQDPLGMAEEIVDELRGANAGEYVAQLSQKAIPFESQVRGVSFNTGDTISLNSGIYLLVSHDAQPILAAIGGTPVVVNEKSTTPSITKEVGIYNGENTSFSDAVIAGFNHVLSYKIVGTLPSNYASFDTYFYSFEDTLGAGITPNLDSIKMTLVSSDGTIAQITQGFSTSFSDGVLAVSFEDLKAAIPDAVYGDQIMLSYTASFSPEFAQIGLSTGNPNTVVLNYRRSPSYSEKGVTKPSSAKVYTFALKLIKVDSATDSVLGGAQFVLKDTSGKQLGSATSAADGTLLFSGLATGKYTLEETSAPDGYQLIAKPITLEISADIDKQELSASVASRDAGVMSVDAQSGLIQVKVSDVQVSQSPFPITGDSLLKVAIGLGVTALMALLLIGVSVRKRKEND